MFKFVKTLALGLGMVFALNVANAGYETEVKDGKVVDYVTEIDGKEYSLLSNSFGLENHLKTLKMLEEAMAENNRLTEAYLKTNSPKWADLMTEAMKANIEKFENVWKRIVIERHYNREVLDAFDKYKTAELDNADKMYEHFYALSTNEPFKAKVKEAQENNKKHLVNNKLVTKRLRTFLN